MKCLGWMRLSLLSSRGGFVTPTRRPRLGALLLPICSVVVLWILAPSAGLEPEAIWAGIPHVLENTQRLFSMPDWSSVPDVGKGLLETIEMALVGTALAVPVAFVLGLLAARNTSFHPAMAWLVRTGAGIGRSIPIFVVAMLLVSVVGLGPMAGVLALFLCSVAYTVPLFAQSLEYVDRGAIEGVEAMGAGKLEIRRYAILPQAMPDLYSTSLFLFDSNLRAATALGIVGAGGIGYELAQSLRMAEFGKVMLLLVAVYLMVDIVDRVSGRLRAGLI